MLKIYGPNFNNLRVGRVGLKLPNKRELLQVRYLASKVNTRIQNITEFVPVEQEIPEHKEGGIIAANLDWKFDIQRFQKGGSVNIIPEGALHARKHNMDIDNVTKKESQLQIITDNNRLKQKRMKSYLEKKLLINQNNQLKMVLNRQLQKLENYW